MVQYLRLLYQLPLVVEKSEQQIGPIWHPKVDR